MIEWASHVQDDDPRWGAPTPPFVHPPVVDVTHMAFVAALVRDPARDGARLAEVLDTTLVEYDHHGGDDAPHVALDLGDCMLALYPVPADEASSRAVWRDHHERPRCIALGLSVDDQPAAEQALAADGVVVHHRAADGRAVFVDEMPFPIVLTDTLLPGDPRATGRAQEER